MKNLAVAITGLVLGAMMTVPAGAQGYGRPGQQYGPQQQQGGWNYNNGDGGRWDPSWDRRADPQRGACFYTDRGFGGHHFCVAAGQRIARLPGDIGGNISSIQTFGGARVVVFDDRNFEGVRQGFGRSIADLQRFPSKPGHTWNNRISSVVVR